MNEFIALDFETATCSPNSAVSIGLVKFRDYQPVDTWYSLIRPPQLYIRPDFTAIHGLTVDDVRDAPGFGHLWENGLLDFLGELPLAAHNASFDMGVLQATLAFYGIPPPKNKYFCSLALSRRIWPALRSHSLSNLAKNFNIQYQAHNALADAHVCGKIIELCANEVCVKTETQAPLAIKDLLKASRLRMRPLTY